LKLRGPKSSLSPHSFALEALESRFLLSGVPIVAPVSAPAVKYDGTSAAVQVAQNVTVASTTPVTSATVAITAGYQAGQDKLAVAGQTGTNSPARPARRSTRRTWGRSFTKTPAPRRARR